MDSSYTAYRQPTSGSKHTSSGRQGVVFSALGTVNYFACAPRPFSDLLTTRYSLVNRSMASTSFTIPFRSANFRLLVLNTTSYLVKTYYYVVGPCFLAVNKPQCICPSTGSLIHLPRMPDLH